MTVYLFQILEEILDKYYNFQFHTQLLEKIKTRYQE